MPVRSYEKEENTIMNLNIEMNLDKIAIERHGYTFLDMLSDCGGVQSILVSMFSCSLIILNHEHFDTFMASKLFKIKKKEKDAN